MGILTFGSKVRVRIVRLPPARETEIDGIDVPPFHVGRSYEVGRRLADYLIVSGYAVLDTAARETATDRPQRKG